MESPNSLYSLHRSEAAVTVCHRPFIVYKTSFKLEMMLITVQILVSHKYNCLLWLLCMKIKYGIKIMGLLAFG